MSEKLKMTVQQGPGWTPKKSVLGRKTIGYIVDEQAAVIGGYIVDEQLLWLVAFDFRTLLIHKFVKLAGFSSLCG